MKLFTFPKLFSAASPAPAFPAHGQWLKRVAAGLIFGALTTILASAQNAGVPINPISYFQVQEGNSAVSWSQTSASVDSSGNSTITFQDGNGGTSTMLWMFSTGNLSSWTINLASGSTQVYTDATGQGQPGSFTLTAGTFGTNNVLSINGHPYVASGNFLAPAQTSSLLGFAPLSLLQFGYGGTLYNYVSTGINYNGTPVGTFANQTSTVVVTGSQGLQTGNQGLQIYCPNGTCAVYSIDSTQRIYTYQISSSATNQLSQINGVTMTAAGNTLLLPVPISSFVWGGVTYTFGSIGWNNYSLLSGNSAMLLFYTGGVASNHAYCGFNGNLVSLQINVYSPQYDVQTITPGTIANTYNLTGMPGPSVFTAINGVPYVAQGSLLVPQGPVGTLSYAGSNYAFTGYSQASDGNWIAQYSTGGASPATAALEYSPSNDTFVKMSINAPAGGTATYVNGASVGQPGAYVWSSTSTAGNLLNAVNNNTFTPAGDSDLPSTATTANGVFAIKGNFLSLGSWTNNANQAGLSLSYYDGQSASAPASIESTASRPSTAWLWDATTSSGTAVLPMMQLDQNSRLLLYTPAISGALPGASGPSPAVILDPSSSNPSEFSGVVRFDGPVRLAPQGDLSMETFLQDPFPAQPTQ